jgi:signal transduction histidine kinase/CheY-like chemotaxis protein
MARQTVLVVDDDRALAENIAEIIEALNVDVDVAGDATTAFARLKTRRYDLALVDVRLPDADGTSLVERIRADSPHTEVVLITGDATVDSAVTAVRLGAFAYVLKPFSPTELLETARRALQAVAHALERERLQRELEGSELKHREVIEAVPALVLALDDRGDIAFWNRRLEELTGFSRNDKLGDPGEGLIGNEDGVRPLATRNGTELLVRWQRSTFSLPDGQRMTYAVGTDVTGEQEMLQRTMRAERLAAVGTLAAGLAHEVRNPLNSALLQLQVLRRRMERIAAADKDTLAPVVALVEDEIRRLEHLVSDFLSFARPRPLELRSTGLLDLFESVVAFVTPELEAAKILVALDVPSDLPALKVDPERLRQVLQNLVRNAVEAMTGGGRLTLRAHLADRGLEIDVADTGPGFSKETPVFDAFFTTKQKGTGLGLSIVHRIVSDHGGTLRVRSQPGETCFTIGLPLEPVT